MNFVIYIQEHNGDKKIRMRETKFMIEGGRPSLQEISKYRMWGCYLFGLVHVFEATICDMIKGNESDVANIDFELQAKRDDKF